MKQFDVTLEVEQLLFEVVGISVELLTKGHWHGILKLCAAHLDGILKLVSLIAESTDKSGETCHERLIQTDDSETDRRRIDIVRRLSAVDVVVGVTVLVLAFLVSHDLKGTVGDDLIGVHVHRCAGTALHHVHGELIVQLAVDDLLASLLDGSTDLIIDDA